METNPTVTRRRMIGERGIVVPIFDRIFGGIGGIAARVLERGRDAGEQQRLLREGSK